MNAITKAKPAGEVVAASETAAVLSMIERAALNPEIDIDKMERLLSMQERILARNAEAAFNEAFAEMMPSLPEIDHKGKGNNDKTYAKWEDIHEKITPVLTTNGFGLSFRTADNSGKIIVTAVLRHKQGHSIQTDISLPSDQSGGKNAVQAVGSSISYGKRYAACALLNIRTRGEDDDGKAASKKTSKVAGGSSMKDASREMLDAAERGEEGAEITDHTKDPLWEQLKTEIADTCRTKDELSAYWSRQKTLKQRKPHFARAFHKEVVVPTGHELPEVPA